MKEEPERLVRMQTLQSSLLYFFGIIQGVEKACLSFAATLKIYRIGSADETFVLGLYRQDTFVNIAELIGPSKNSNHAYRR